MRNPRSLRLDNFEVYRPAASVRAALPIAPPALSFLPPAGMQTKTRAIWMTALADISAGVACGLRT
jgi:hypothetical protein